MKKSATKKQPSKRSQSANGHSPSSRFTFPPVPPSPDGSDGATITVPESGDKGRNQQGRFAPGNKCGRGNPFARRVAALRTALLDSVTPNDIQALTRKLKEQALAGDVAAAKLLLAYVLGQPAPVVDPDRLDLDEAEIAAEAIRLLLCKIEARRDAEEQQERQGRLAGIFLAAAKKVFGEKAGEDEGESEDEAE